MTGLTDLKKATSDLATAVVTAVNMIGTLQSENTSLTSQLAAANAEIATLQGNAGTGGDSDADVETAAQDVETQVEALNTATGTPAPIPAPAVGAGAAVAIEHA